MFKTWTMGMHHSWISGCWSHHNSKRTVWNVVVVQFNIYKVHSIFFRDKSENWKISLVDFVHLFDSLRLINNLSVIKGRVFLGWTSTKLGQMFLLKDTTQWRQWGSNLRPLGLESSTLPLSHCAPYNLGWKITIRLMGCPLISHGMTNFNHLYLFSFSISVDWRLNHHLDVTRL